MAQQIELPLEEVREQLMTLLLSSPVVPARREQRAMALPMVLTGGAGVIREGAGNFGAPDPRFGIHRS